MNISQLAALSECLEGVDIERVNHYRQMLRAGQKIDPIIGLDSVSRKYLVRLIRESGPLGSRTLANYVEEQEITVTGMIEPFLFSDIELQFGDAGNLRVQKSPFVRITSKGRIALEPAYNYIKLCHSLQKQGWFTNESLNVKPE